MSPDDGDAVGLGEVEKPKLDQRHKELKQLLDTAVSAEGDGILTGYEEGLVKGMQTMLQRMGNNFDPSFPQQQALDRIEGKLEKEGLL